MVEKELGIKKEYEGGMDSKYYFSASQLGATTSPQVANQIGELNSRLNQGLNAVELGAMNQRILDQVPKEHFEEVHRMSKLTGLKASLHAPIQDLDLAGFTQDGWDPNQRERSVRQLNSAIDKAHLMDPEGNTPVTVHAGSSPVNKWEKEGLEEYDRKTGEIRKVEDRRSEMLMINEHSKQMSKATYRKRRRIGMEGEIPFTAEDQVDMANRSQWDDEKHKLLQFQKEIDEKEMMTHNRVSGSNYEQLITEKNAGIISKEGEEELSRLKKVTDENMDFKRQTYENMRLSMEDMYERFEKYPNKHEDGTMTKSYEDYKNNEYPKFDKELKEGQEQLGKLAEKYDKLSEAGASRDEIEDVARKHGEISLKQTNIMREAFQDMPAPQVWKPVDEFAQEKVSDSVSEAAAKSFKEYGDKSPLILLENVYPEFALSRAETLKDTVEDAREKFVKLATDKKGELKLNKREAEKQAEKLIGVTWDVGHIYMLKKSGYTDKDIEEESKKIAPYVKHLHLTDNFGFEDSHLPPGLGDTNIKEQLRAIEIGKAEAGDKEGFNKLRGIVEAGEFVANYKEVPHLYALSHLGSSMYSENAGPSWQESWDQFGAYGGGYGELLPQKYFDLYGSPSFSQLPAALGGSAGGSPDRGRFASSAGSEDE
jgi:sugar phosphate isomerase/epimerase